MLIINPRCEWQAGVVTTDVPAPRLTWELSSTVQGDLQTACQVQCGSTPGASDLWDSGKIASNAQIVPYAGVALASRQRVYWRVRVWGAANTASQWAAGVFEIGLLATADWDTALWIGYQTGPVAGSSPAACVRKNFAVTKTVTSARLYASALGVYVPHLNGQRVGQVEMAPGWTDYGVRRQYQTYDVTALVKSGANALGLQIGDGWARGYMSLRGRNYYGADVPRGLCALYIDYSDGTFNRIVTDATWLATTAANLANDHYNGVTHDNRRAFNFTDPALSTTSWPAVSTIALGGVPLVAQPSPPVQRMQRINAVAVTNPTTGTYVFDFGINHSGTGVVSIAGAAPGQRLQLRYAEDLKKDGSGTLYTANLRAAAQTDVVFCAGAPTELVAPRFGQKGFRYVELTGFSGVPPIGIIGSHQLYTPSPMVSTFDCSSAVLRGSWLNAVRSWQSNALSIPSDCNQRDERLGWTADAQLFAGSAIYVQDSTAFLDKYCTDLDDSANGGLIGDVAPFVSDVERGHAAWGDAAVAIPWTLYQAYGDTRLLSKHWPTMKAVLAAMPYPDGYNDYLNIGQPTDVDVFRYAFAYRVASIMKRAADVLGDGATATSASNAMASFSTTWNGKVSAGGATIGNNSQTSYILGLAFGILPAGQRAAAFTALVNAIAANGLRCGFVGLTFLHDVLADNGRLDLAYALAEKTTAPSLGFTLGEGMTTTAEQWDSVASQGSNDGANSYNHYVRGAVLSWIARTVAGIDAGTPGFAQILFRPRPGGGTTWASLGFDGPRGRIESTWNVRAAKMLWHIVIPANSTGLVTLPAGYTIAKIGGADISTIGSAQSADPITGGARWLLPSGTFDLILTA